MTDQNVDTGYVPREWQMKVHARRLRYSIWVLHRRAGKTVALIMEAIRTAIGDPADTRTKQYPHVALIYPQRGQAERVAWPILKSYARKFPNVKIKENALQVIFAHNGGTISLFGTHNGQYEAMRGLRFNLACFDEYAQCDAAALPEVVRPALSDEEGDLIICGTPQGRDKFYETWVNAGNHLDVWSRFMLKASESGIISAEELQASSTMLTEDVYAREYECEFTAMPAGAFYSNEITALRKSGRVTTLLPSDKLPIIAAMDVGISDSTVMWFAQIVGTSINIFDCKAWTDTSLRDILASVRSEYDVLYLGVPHDMGHREQTSGAPKYMMIMDLMPGTEVEVLPRTRVEEGIFMVRQMFSQLRFDDQHCEEGLEYLASYVRKFSRDTQMFLNVPRHDTASDYADALRYLAQLLDYLAGGDGTGTGGTIDQTIVNIKGKHVPRVVGLMQ